MNNGLRCTTIGVMYAHASRSPATNSLGILNVSQRGVATDTRYVSYHWISWRGKCQSWHRCSIDCSFVQLNRCTLASTSIYLAINGSKKHQAHRIAATCTFSNWHLCRQAHQSELIVAQKLTIEYWKSQTRKGGAIVRDEQKVRLPRENNSRSERTDPWQQAVGTPGPCKQQEDNKK